MHSQSVLSVTSMMVSGFEVFYLKNLLYRLHQ